MKNNNVISVIIPIHKYTDKIQDIRNCVLEATTPIEIIFVIDKNVESFIDDKKNFES